MSVVAAYVYKDGVRTRAADLTAEGLKLKAGEFAWVGLLDPTAAELDILKDRFGLHPLAVEDAVSGRQTPKVDVYGDQLFVAAKTAHLEGETIAYGETDIFVGRHFIITVRHGSTRGYTELRSQLEAAPAHLKHGPDYVLHAVLDFIVEGYFPIVEQIEDEVLANERRALDAFLSRADVNHIFATRQSLMRFLRILGPMEEVTTIFQHHDIPCIDAEVRLYFRDVGDHVRRVAGQVDVLLDVLTNVFEVSTLLEQQRQGVITRQLAAWAAILAIPTAVAGIYGMNFDFMPELHWRYGYGLVVGGIFALCGLLFVLFKRSKWL